MIYNYVEKVKNSPDYIAEPCSLCSNKILKYLHLLNQVL